MAERLPLPVKRALAQGDDAVSLARVRGRIDRELDRRRRAPVRALAFACAALILLAVGFIAGRASRPLAVAPPAPVAPPASTSARAPTEMTSEEGRASQTLDDGTRIELSPRSALRVRANTPERVEVLLERGEARFAVAKRPERSFHVDAGNVAIDVRGTTFSVVRSGEGATVSVEEGRVEITTPAGTRTLVGGERFPPAPPSPPDAAPALAPTTPAWRPLAARGAFSAAYAALGKEGVVREAAAATDPETLFSLADVARLSGHPADAVAPLRRILSDHRDDARASLAAFTLAKLELESLDHARDAARLFEDALRLHPPPSIAEDASARRVEAYARSGELGSARAAAAEYRAAYPGGRYDAEVTKWASAVP